MSDITPTKKLKHTLGLCLLWITLGGHIRLLEVIHAVIHVSTDAVIYNKVILGQPASNDGLVLVFRYFIVYSIVFFELGFVASTCPRAEPEAHSLSSSLFHLLVRV